MINTARSTRTAMVLACLLGMLAYASAVALPSAAQQEPELGELTADPSSDTIDLETGPTNWAQFTGSDPCPSAGFAVVYVIPEGDDPLTEGVRVGFVTVPTNPADPSTVNANVTWADLFDADPPIADELPATRQVVLRCTPNPSQPGTAISTAWITFDEQQWRIMGERPEGDPTSISGTADPAGSAEEGAEVTFTATLTPAEAEGSVRFSEEGEELAVEPVDNGTATFTTDELEVGEHLIDMEFVPDDLNAYQGVTLNPPSFYTIVEAGSDVVDTSLALTVDPAPPVDPGTEVTLTAQVNPTDAEGEVEFFVGGDSLGEPVELSDAEASLTTTELPEGSLELSAQFTPDDPSAFAPSTSSTVDYRVGEGGDDDITFVAVDADGNELGANPLLSNGDEVTITATGFDGEEDVEITLAPLQELLGTAPAAEGEVTVDFPVSGLDAGAFELVFTGQTSQLSGTWPFEIESDDPIDDPVDGDPTAQPDESGGSGAPNTPGGGELTNGGELAKTGQRWTPALLLGVGLVGLGMLLVWQRRRNEYLSFDSVGPPL